MARRTQTLTDPRSNPRDWDFRTDHRELRMTDLEVGELADLLCLPISSAIRVYAQVGC